MGVKVGVTVRIDMNDACRLDEVVSALRSRGLSEVESHPRFMIINGNVEVEAIESLKAVRGVEAVRQDGVYKAISG